MPSASSDSSRNTPQIINNKLSLVKVDDANDCINNKLYWDIDEPDQNLISWFMRLTNLPTTVLELGCGSGDNAVWLAKQGCQVTVVDFHNSAITKTKQLAEQHKVKVNVIQQDLIKDAWIDQKFDLVFDRGYFHTLIADRNDMIQFVSNLKNCLNANGIWVSLIGSKDPYKNGVGVEWFLSANDIVSVVDSELQILKLKAITIDCISERKMSGWLLVSCLRTQETLKISQLLST